MSPPRPSAALPSEIGRCASRAETLDLVIVGSGGAAFGAALRTSELGARVAVVERGTLGGTCVRAGRSGAGGDRDSHHPGRLPRPTHHEEAHPGDWTSERAQVRSRGGGPRFAHIHVIASAHPFPWGLEARAPAPGTAFARYARMPSEPLPLPQRPSMRPEWTPEAAERQAEALGLRLTARHWQVLASARESCLRTGHVPDARALAAGADLTREELDQLFPGPTCETVSRLAGLDDASRRGTGCFTRSPNRE